ncbi:MAG TPA: ABC transporter permease, partial [Puia sp.]|nr:ABC transporter permease [Puia sp.]
MLKNYLKVAMRNLYKQGTISFINIFGLSVGIACFCLCLLYAVHELNFDGYHKNAKDIYLVVNKPENQSPGNSQFISTSMPMGPAMKKELPGVVDFMRLVQPFPHFIKVKGKASRENVAYADPAIFSIFTFSPEFGNLASGLDDGHHVVLTESMASRLFGKANAVGETVDIKVDDAFVPFAVSAIVKDPPTNSFLQFGIMAPFTVIANTAFGKMSADYWGWSSYITFVQLDRASNLAANDAVIKAFKSKHFNKGLGSGGSYSLLPLKSLHLSPNVIGFRIATIDPQKIWMLCGIAAAVLLIACINFTTLAIGRSARRSKEVGVRKIIGGSRSAVAWQFLLESWMLAVVSTVMGFALAQLLLPWFNELSDRHLSFSFGQFPILGGLIVAMVLVVGIVAGSYPALVLSGLKIIEVLKTRVKLGGSNLFMRSLVVTQFVLSAGLIIGALVIMQQLKYMQSRNPGFDKENVIAISVFGMSDTKKVYDQLKHQLASSPEIISTSSDDMGLGASAGLNTTTIDHEGKPLDIVQFYVDPGYVPTLKMQILAGRDFDAKISSDTVNSVIINETLMHDLGLNLQNSIGHELEGYGNWGVRGARIIGIIKDINFQDYSHHVEAMLLDEFTASHRSPACFYVRIPAGDPSKSLSVLRAAWKQVAPDYPLLYSFLDENLDRFYAAEQRLGGIISAAGIAGILLACLGLLG